MQKNRTFYIGLYLAIFVALLTVLSCLLMLSTYAADFDGQPLGVGVSYRITLGTASSNGATVTFYFDSLPGSPKESYVFFAGTKCYFTAYSTGSAVIDGSKHYRTVNVTSGTAQGQIDGKTIYFVSFDNLSDYATTSVPVYASESDAFNALKALIEGDPEPEVPVRSLSYDLPPGNIAYIPIPSGQSTQIPYTLTTTFPMAFGNNDLSRVNQVVTVTTSLPSGASNQAPTSPLIAWVNNGSINLFGTSAHKIYNGTVSNSLGGYYLVVSNPMTMKSESGPIGGDILTNPSIHIEMDAVAGSPIIYPMSDQLTITAGNGIDTESTFGDTGYTFEVDPDTGEIIWTAPDGSNSAPVAGGNNPMPTPNTIFDWLRNISTQLADFLKGPVNAVQIVVGAIRDFMGSFTQLYQWLPSPVYSLITSALMIALTIGVIKIFV